jgi:hypothetical protein
MPYIHVSQEGKLIVLVILSKKVMYVCPIPNGFRDKAVSLYSS